MQITKSIFFWPHVVFNLTMDRSDPPPGAASWPLLGKNRQLVTNESVEFAKNMLKFETSGELSIVVKDCVEYTSNE